MDKTKGIVVFLGMFIGFIVVVAVIGSVSSSYTLIQCQPLVDEQLKNIKLKLLYSKEIQIEESKTNPREDRLRELYQTERILKDIIFENDQILKSKC